MNIERVGWVALVLSGALVLHLFMLTGVPQPPAGAAAHAYRVTQPGAVPASGHDASAPHGAAEMLSTCFAVLALVTTAGIRHLLARHGKPTSYGLDGPAAPPGQRAAAATSSPGSSHPSRVDAGVLLRV